MKPLTHKIVSACILPLALTGVSVAYAAQSGSTLPPLHKADGIEYLSGGIGKDEAKAMEQAGAHWPLMLKFTQKTQHKDAFTAGAEVHVRDKQGHTVLQVQSDGPILLARVKPGHYRVEASVSGQTLRHDVTVKPGHMAQLNFAWPQARHTS
jgi:hypothetical protein